MDQLVAVGLKILVSERERIYMDFPPSSSVVSPQH